MQTASGGPSARDLLYSAVVVLASLGAALLLHVGAGSEPPDNPGAAAQLAAAGGQQVAPVSAASQPE
jgi:hypothetical protein